MTRPKPQAVQDDKPLVSPEQLTRILQSTTDISIILDENDVIQSINANPNTPDLDALGHWRGNVVFDVLEDVSAQKLRKNLELLRSDPSVILTDIELNHEEGADRRFPVRYTMMAAGSGEKAFLVGQSLQPLAELQQQLVRAQLALERDYEKHRDYETKFRVLLDRSGEAIVLLDSDGTILHFNAAAAELMGGGDERSVAGAFEEAFESRRDGELMQKIAQCAQSDADQHVTARRRFDGNELLISPTLFRSAGEVAMLCRLHATASGRPTGGTIDDSLRGLFDQGCDGIVFADAKGVIQHVNKAFLALAALPQLSDAKGKSLADFLARGGVDLKVLLEHTAASGRMRLYATKLKSPFGAQEPVEISATRLAARRAPLNAFVFRSISRGEVAVDTGNDEAMRNVMELVGSTPLKEIVAATADVVERMCIETAVELTQNNRVAAAELLGLSRQSLYVKLRKYGLVKSKEADER